LAKLQSDSIEVSESAAPATDHGRGRRSRRQQNFSVGISADAALARIGEVIEACGENIAELGRLPTREGLHVLLEQRGRF
jgi:hypothetical protein